MTVQLSLVMTANCSKCSSVVTFEDSRSAEKTFSLVLIFQAGWTLPQNLWPLNVLLSLYKEKNLCFFFFFSENRHYFKPKPVSQMNSTSRTYLFVTNLFLFFCRKKQNLTRFYELETHTYLRVGTVAQIFCIPRKN